MGARLDSAVYRPALEDLQLRLVRLQEAVRRDGLRVAVLLEGRDAAGKGGVIGRITKHLSARTCRVVALDVPTERERTQWYFQRYVAHLPAVGEIVLFDRSWYNRAGVERVMGFCSPEELDEFFRACPDLERAWVRSGIVLVKYWLEVSAREQAARFRERVADPTKRWKLSPVDVEAHRRYEDYTRARDEMLRRTDIPEAPWYLVDAEDQRRARLNAIAHLLETVPHRPREPEALELPEPSASPRRAPSPEGIARVPERW